MTPLQKLKKGIEDLDWSLVVDGYNSFTGENIEIQEDYKNSDEDESTAFSVLSEIYDVLSDFFEEDRKNKIIEHLVDEREDTYVELEDNSVEYTEKEFEEANNEVELVASKKEIIEEKYIDSPILRQSGKKMSFFTTEPTKEDLEEASSMALLRGNDNGRSEYKPGKCELCGVETDYTGKIDDCVVFLCNKCAIRSRRR